jgi:hypothetical protein
MSESDASYQEIDLDNLPADPKLPSPTDDFEIVDENAAAPEQPAEPAPAPKTSAANQAAEVEDDGDDGSEAQQGERKRLTRSQRLKAQRDLYAQQLAQAQQEIEALRTKANKFETDSVEAANIGLDFYIQTIDSNMRALRSEFDAAFDAGDRAKIFEVQQRMAELAAEKKQAEREKRAIPPKAGPSPTQTGQTTPPAPASNAAPSQPAPPPAAVEWASRNQDWFNKDRVMTAAAFAIDQAMIGEGYQPSDPDYFEELDKRIRTEFPHKFQQAAPAPAARPAASPTIQNRAAAAPTNGKVRVVITPEDRRFAEQMGIDIQTYAREKAKRERALQTATQYTEIL